MVTQNTETVSTPDTADLPSTSTEADLTVQSGEVLQETFALDPNGAIVVESDGTAVEPNADQPEAEATEPEATEQPEETATEEPAAEETPAEEEPTEEPAAPVSVRDTEEFRSLQSAADRQIAEAQARAAAAEAQAAAQRSQNEIDTQVEAHRRNLTAWYEQQGITPDQAAEQIESAAANFRGNLEGAVRAEQANQTQVAQSQRDAYGSLTDWTNRLKEAHSLSDEVVTSLNRVAAMGATSMTSFYDAQGNPTAEFTALGNTLSEIAQSVGSATAAQAETKATEARLAEVPAGGPENQLDSGGVQSGSQSDEQFLADYAAGLNDDMERAREIMRKRGEL